MCPKHKMPPVFLHPEFPSGWTAVSNGLILVEGELEQHSLFTLIFPILIFLTKNKGKENLYSFAQKAVTSLSVLMLFLNFETNHSSIHF